MQIDYSIDDREAERRILPLAAEVRAGVLTAVPFGRGRLFRAVRERPLPDWAQGFAGSWAQFFLKYLLGDQRVTAVIPGTADAAHMTDNLGAMRGLEYPHQVEITVDGERVHLGKFGGNEDFKWALENITLAADDAERRSGTRVNLKAGPREIGIAFLDMPGENTLRLQPFIRSSNDTLDPSGHAHIDSFTITGPQ